MGESPFSCLGFELLWFELPKFENSMTGRSDIDWHSTLLEYHQASFIDGGVTSAGKSRSLLLANSIKEEEWRIFSNFLVIRQLEIGKIKRKKLFIHSYHHHQNLGWIWPSDIWSPLSPKDIGTRALRICCTDPTVILPSDIIMGHRFTTVTVALLLSVLRLTYATTPNDFSVVGNTLSTWNQTEWSLTANQLVQGQFQSRLNLANG